MTNPGLSGGRAMLELAERCEKATGPDCGLERDIAKALGWRHLRNKGPSQDEEPYHWVAPDGGCHEDFPDYLSSLDAAMTLVPEGWWVQFLGQRIAGWSCRVETNGPPSQSLGLYHAPTGALTLCAAALRARAADTPDSQGDG